MKKNRLFRGLYFGCGPLTVTVVNEGLQGSPTKNVIILVVTVTYLGATTQIILPNLCRDYYVNHYKDPVLKQPFLASFPQVAVSSMLPFFVDSKKRFGPSNVGLQKHMFHSFVF